MAMHNTNDEELDVVVVGAGKYLLSPLSDQRH